MPSPYRPAGVIVPLVTPFAPDGSVDLTALERLGHAVLDAGATGVVALATTGEPTSLDDRDRAAVVAVCAELCAARGADLIVGAGTNDTRTTIARHAALAAVQGVRAALAVVPYYVRPSEAGIVARFQAVAARSPVPLVVYNIPYRTGRGLGAEALRELAATENIAGLRQSVGALDLDTLRVLAQAPAGFSVLSGDDPYLVPCALMGATGAIAASSHVVTARFVAMLDDAVAGRGTAARRQAEALLPLITALFAEPNPAVIKAVLHAEGQIPTPDLRMPMSAASRAGTARAVAALAAVRDG